MNEQALIISAACVGYVAVGGVVARLLKGCGDEWVVPATMFWPAFVACLLVVAVAVVPYMATDQVIKLFERPRLPKAKVHK